DEGKVAFAARCARYAMHILKGMSFPIAAVDLVELETVVRLVEEAATGWVDSSALRTALRDLGHLAFTSPPPYSFRTGVVLSYIAHAVYAAGLRALTGWPSHVQDTVEYALEAARTAGTADVETSVRECLYALRRKAVLPKPAGAGSDVIYNA